MYVAVSVIALQSAYVGQFQLALLFLLQGRGHSHRVASPASEGYSINGPVCPPGCSSCSQINKCVTCRSGFALLVHWKPKRQIGTCVRTCPSGHFVANTSKGDKCIKCGSPRCELCTNGTSCARCHSPFALHRGQCLVACPPEQPFFIESSGHCASQLNCEVGHWSAWSECRRKGEPVCGSKRGRQKRQRPVVQQPTAGGLQCPALIEFRKCRVKSRNCEDLLATDNNSDGMTKMPNRLVGRKWLQLVLKNRSRKLKHRPMEVYDGDGSRKKQLVQSERSGERVRQPSNRRRIDVNSIESRHN